MQQPQIDIALLVSKIALYDDERAYKLLFQLLYGKLKQFAMSILQCKEQAEEVACDTMYVLWQNRANLPKLENVKLYAYVIVKNRALNVLKRESRSCVSFVDEIDVQLAFHHHTPEQILIGEELKFNIQQVLNTLPPRCRAVFKLVKEDQMSYKEVAELLEISTKTVDAQLVNAMRRVSAVLKKEYNLVR